MKRSPFTRRTLVAATVLASLVVGVLGVGAAIAWVTPPDSPAITTCVAKATGYVRVIDPATQKCGSWETPLYLHNSTFAHKTIVRWGDKLTIEPFPTVPWNGNAHVMCAVDKRETAVGSAYTAGTLQITNSYPLDKDGNGIGAPSGGEVFGWGFRVENHGSSRETIIPGVICQKPD